MTERQKGELSILPIGKMLVVNKELREVGKVRAMQLLDEYEERLAIITEGRDVQPEDISAAWANVLHIDDLMPAPSKQGDE